MTLQQKKNILIRNEPNPLQFFFFNLRAPNLFTDKTKKNINLKSLNLERVTNQEMINMRCGDKLILGGTIKSHI